MNRLIVTFGFFFISFNLIAQETSESFQYFFKLDSSYLFIDNSNRNWYSLELVTDTLFNIEKNIYFYDGKSIQIGSVQFNNGNSVGVMGSIKGEEYALIAHKKWELEYQTKTLQQRLKDGQEFYYGRNGKPFLIWWYKTPKNSKIPDREIEVTTKKVYHKIPNDSSSIELNATHQLFLYFTVHGNTSVSISTQVLENEALAVEISKLKKIANTLNVYGSYIDLNFLLQRSKSKEKVVLKDSLDLIEIEIPSYINVCKSPYKDVFSLSFPEKENITNAVSILCVSKSNSETFDDFKSKYFPNKADANSLKLLSKENKKEQYFFTEKSGWFYGQSIFLEGENTFCFIKFVATKTTYDFNLDRFKDLLNKISIK